jgi:sulfite reductase alpha subunit-like flavoprotein
MKTPNELALVTLQEFSSTGTKGNKQLPSKNDSYRGAEYSTRKVWLPKVPIASTKSTFVISVLLVEVLVLKCTTMAPLHFYLTLFCICLTGGVVWSERWKSSRVASSSEKGSTAKPIDTKDIETFLNHYDCPVGIFYGSESGYTKGLALALSIKCGLMAKLMDPEDFDMMSLSSVSSSRLVLFVIATSGDGDFPENVKSLHRTIEVMLQQKAARLPNLQYGLFAVGNHNYTQFNEAGRILQRALVHLGAIPVVPYTEGDTALECNQLFAQWEVKALAAAKHFSGISDNAVKINDQTAQIALELAQLPVNGEAELDQYIEFVEKAGFTRRHSAMKVKLQIAKQWEVFNNQDGLQKYFQVKLISLTNEPFLFCAGDVVKIFPENSPALVNNLARVLNLCDLNETVVIRQYSNASLFDFPPPTSIRTLFSRYLDIASPVTNDFIEFALEQVTIAVDTKNHIELQLVR